MLRPGPPSTNPRRFAHSRFCYLANVLTSYPAFWHDWQEKKIPYWHANVWHKIRQTANKKTSGITGSFATGITIASLKC